MSLDASIAQVQSNVPDCVAVGLVDLSTGMLLSIKTTDSHPQEVLDLVAAATSDLYQGSNVIAIENAFKRIRGVNDDSHYFQEIIVTSKNLLHVFIRSKKNDNFVMVIVCRVNVNLGMALSKARLGLTAIDANF